tara:strand:- start:962 stop:1648 length:687 start_codon:yes stop_codon:yes gene_type:complete
MDGDAELVYPDPRTSTANYNPESLMQEEVFDFRQYEFNGSITAQIDIENIAVGRNDKLTAYIGDEIRGEVSPMLFAPTNEYVFPLMVFGSSKESKELTFEYYNSITGEIYNVSETMKFVADMIIGDGMTPFPLTDSESVLPSAFELKNAYPNPFNPTTNISYAIGEYGFVDVAIYDITGRVVESLVSGYQEQGNYDLTWNADGLPSGLYFVKLTADKFSQTQKLMLIK